MKEQKFKNILIDNAWSVLRLEGKGSLNVRKLTKLSNCSLGGFYNFFENTDELFFHVNAKSVELLFGALKKDLVKSLKIPGVTLKQALVSLGRTYIAFSETHVNLWKALFESITQESFPEWYKAKTRSLLKELEEILSKHFETSYLKMHKTIAFFWVAMHGISSILLNRKIYVMDDIIDDQFIDYYISHCIDGLV